ncbi:MAG: winged helix DNA-binding protein [Bacteroidota bacterium]
MKYQQIQRLIEAYEQFEEETSEQNLGSFGVWLQEREQAPFQERQPEQGPPQILEAFILQHFAMLSNFAKLYLKKVLRNTPLAGWNDLVALIVLYYGGSLRKTELIQRGIMEVSPGIEVVRRLLRLGLIEEFPDPEDGRAKRVKLTTSGKEMYEGLQPELNQVSQVVSGNLSTGEKTQLAPLLEKLVQFHVPIWEKSPQAELTDLLDTYFG